MLVLCFLVRVVETSSSVVEQDANNAITVTKQTEWLIFSSYANTAVRRIFYHNVSCSTASASGTLTGSVG